MHYLSHNSIPQIPLDSPQRKQICWSHIQPLDEQHRIEFQNCNIHSTSHLVWKYMSGLDHFDMVKGQLVAAVQIVPQPYSIHHQLHYKIKYITHCSDNST